MKELSLPEFSREMWLGSSGSSEIGAEWRVTIGHEQITQRVTIREIRFRCRGKSEGRDAVWWQAARLGRRRRRLNGHEGEIRYAKRREASAAHSPALVPSMAFGYMRRRISNDEGAGRDLEGFM